MPQQAPDFIPHQQATPDFIPHQAPVVQENAPARGVPAPAQGKSFQMDVQNQGGAQQPWPEWFGTGLLDLNKAFVEPFEKMSDWGAKHVGDESGRMAEDAYRLAQGNQQAQVPPSVSGIGQGVGGTLGSMATDPRQLMLMAGSLGTGLFGRAASVGFGTQMGVGAVKQAGQLGEVWDREDVSAADKWKLGTEATLGTVMGGLAGGGAVGPHPDFIPHQEAADFIPHEEAPSISKQPANAAVKSASPAPSGLEALRAAKMAAGGEQPNVTIEGGPRPVSEHGLTAANQPGEAKGTAPSDTAFVGEKQAKIESQQVTGPNRDAWVAQQRDFMIGKLQEVLRNPQVTPQERQVAQSMLDEFRQQAGGGQQQVAQQPQQVAPQPRFEPIATPKPFRPDKNAPSQTRGAGIDTAKLLADQVAKGRISEADAASTAQRAGVGQVKPPGKIEALGRQVADLQERTQRPAGQGPTYQALPKQTPEEVAADRELLERAQAPASPKESMGAPTQAKTGPATQPSARPDTTEPVRSAPLKVTKDSMGVRWAEDPATGYKVSVPSRIGLNELEAYARPKLAEQAQIHSGLKESLATPQTPAKAPGKPVEARKGVESGSEASLAQKPLSEAVKPKKGQEGFLSLRGKAIPKAEKAAKSMAKKLDLTVADLGSPAVADNIRAARELQEDKGSYKDHEAIYHNLENPNEPLTAKQQAIKDAAYQPWLDEAARAREKLNKRGLPQIENYVHRIALAKDAKLEKVITQGMKYSSGARLSKSAPGLHERTMKGMEVPGLGHTVVHIKDGEVTAFVNKKEIPLGNVEDLEAKGAKFVESTTKRIEKDSDQQYYKHGLVSTVLNTLELRRAERASDAIEEFKKDPEFKYIAKKEGSQTFEKGWGTVQHPQLKGYVFEPRTKEVLDRYYEDMTKGDPSAMEKANSWLRTSIFMNPIKHIKNIGVHWAVEKGASTLVRPDKWVTIAKTGLQAIEDVRKQNDNFLYAHDMGAPLQSGRRSSNQLQKLLITKMTQDVMGNPSVARKVATIIGKSPVEFTKMWYDMSNKATWTFDDVLRLQSIYQHMSENKGLSFKEATQEVSKHLPDYRIPTRVLNSKTLSKLMRNPNVTMFGAYHYGALKSYVEMAKDLTNRGVPMEQRAKAFDRLAMLGLMTLAVYPALDQLAKKITGKSDARAERSGAATFIDNLYQVLRGEKGMVPAGESVMTPAPLPNILLRMATNPLTSHISPQHPMPLIAAPDQKSQLKSALKDVAEQVGPLNQTGAVKKGVSHIDWKRFWLGILGVRYGADPKSGGSTIPKLGGLKGISRIK